MKGKTEKEDVNHEPDPSQATLLKSPPNYSNDKTLAALKKVGDYVYGPADSQDADLPVLGPYMLRNQAIYTGQWKEGRRQGRGKQIWKDGSQYEGLWKNDAPNGKGRYIQASGNVVDGVWNNGKNGIITLS